MSSEDTSPPPCEKEPTQDTPSPDESTEETTTPQNPEPNPTEEPRDDFSEYLKHEYDTFTGPARETWEKEQEARLKAQDEAECREAEAMAARAEAARQQYLEQLAQQRQERSKPPPPPAESPTDGDWNQVMKMVAPSGKQLPDKDVRQIKRLYHSLKDH